MRMFIISIIVLAVIITCVVCNSLYMDNLTNQMLDLISELPENSDPNGDTSIIDELYDIWKLNQNFIAVTANSVHITDIIAALADTKQFYLSENNTHYQCARENLYQAMYRLHELERFSLDNII